MTNGKSVVVVSGGMGSIGLAAARAFAPERYQVVVLYRDSTDAEVNEVRASLPGNPLFVHCNVSDEHDAARAIKEILSKTSRIDIAIHAAVDPIKRERLLDMEEAAFRSQFEAGFFGAFNFMRPVARIMKDQGRGTLIGITSTVIGSAATPARTGAYAVCKIALCGLLRELHRELSLTGVRVIAVAPDLMRTGVNADLPEKFFEIAERHSDAAPLTTAGEVARVLVTVCENATVPSGVSYLVSSGVTTPL